eukprot:GEMP01062309.1.p1 GENE.GEMP01062309.1~~GEMP01062309.1.p1  ORF type:complete len:125 (+),score=31.21 GEMP01062309.1:50-424(+)
MLKKLNVSIDFDSVPPCIGLWKNDGVEIIDTNEGNRTKRGLKRVAKVFSGMNLLGGTVKKCKDVRKNNPFMCSAFMDSGDDSDCSQGATTDEEIMVTYKIPALPSPNFMRKKRTSSKSSRKISQ